MIKGPSTPAGGQGLVTTTSASITEGAVEGSISIERCSSGVDQERACAAMFRAVPPGVMKFDSVEPGYAVIKLWHSPSLSPALYISASHANRGYEKLGARTETIVEAVSFSGSAEATLSKGHSASGVTVLQATPFMDSRGIGMARPSYTNGQFVASRPAFGTLVVSYHARYTAYRIYYGLPDWVIKKIFLVGASMEDFTIPPLLVMAFDRGHAATAQIERRIAQVRPPDCQADEWITDPGESTVVKYRVYSEEDLDPQTGQPKSGANHLTALGYLKHVECCKQRVSRKRIQNYPMPQGKNIEIISVTKGAL